MQEQAGKQLLTQQLLLQKKQLTRLLHAIELQTRTLTIACSTLKVTVEKEGINSNISCTKREGRKGHHESHKPCFHVQQSPKHARQTKKRKSVRTSIGARQSLILFIQESWVAQIEEHPPPLSVYLLNQSAVPRMNQSKASQHTRLKHQPPAYTCSWSCSRTGSCAYTCKVMLKNRLMCLYKALTLCLQGGGALLTGWETLNPLFWILQLESRDFPVAQHTDTRETSITTFTAAQLLFLAIAMQLRQHLSCTHCLQSLQDHSFTLCLSYTAPFPKATA